MAMNNNLDKFKSLLNELSSKEDFIILSSPQTGNFIQFAWENTNELLVDIPTEELESRHPYTDIIKNKIDNLNSSGCGSLQKKCEITEAINITKIFFENICNLQGDYYIESCLYKGGDETTSFIGSKPKDKIDFLFCDFVQGYFSIVQAYNLEIAKDKYTLHHIDIDESLIFDIEIRENEESQFWEVFAFGINNDKIILEKLQKEFSNDVSEELLSFYNDKKLLFNDLSIETKKAIAKRDINLAIKEGTLLIKPCAQIKRIE